MQRLDRATLIELQWRDLLFWPVVRPLGILWEYLLLGVLAVVPPLRRFDTAIRKELFTLANLVSFYGFLLIWQLVALMCAWWNGTDTPQLWSVGAVFFGLTEPTLWTTAWLVTEIILTDLVDGPLARVNARVSALGTLLDHARDYIVSFVALFFLVAVTIRAEDWTVLALEVGNIIGLSLVMWYFGVSFKKIVRENAHLLGGGAAFVARWKAMFKHALLEEYQTNLTGRIHFAALAFVVGSGIFYYATEARWIEIFFTAALTVTIMISSYYLYELWGGYYQRWEERAHEKSQELKEKLAEKIEKRHILGGE